MFVSKVSAWGVAKLVKAADFDSAMRGFESFLPSQQIRGTRTGDQRHGKPPTRLIFCRQGLGRVPGLQSSPLG